MSRPRRGQSREVAAWDLLRMFPYKDFARRPVEDGKNPVQCPDPLCGHVKGVHKNSGGCLNRDLLEDGTVSTCACTRNERGKLPVVLASVPAVAPSGVAPVVAPSGVAPVVAPKEG